MEITAETLVCDVTIELPSAIPMLERRLGTSHPEVFQGSEAFASIRAELTHHFFWEERVLFPYIAQALAKWEQDLHIHIENNILFLRALAVSRER